MKYLDEVKVLTDKYKLQQKQKVVSRKCETTFFSASWRTNYHTNYTICGLLLLLQCF